MQARPQRRRRIDEPVPRAAQIAAQIIRLSARHGVLPCILALSPVKTDEPIGKIRVALKIHRADGNRLRRKPMFARYGELLGPGICAHATHLALARLASIVSPVTSGEGTPVKCRGYSRTESIELGSK